MVVIPSILAVRLLTDALGAGVRQVGKVGPALERAFGHFADGLA
jgi:hypothetical protein